MCLLLIAHGAHPRLALAVAANRDEDYGRPTEPAHYWPEAPRVLAGRDLEGGGTWLGITTSGRFAAITNFREPGRRKEAAPSRGGLVLSFLEGESSPARFLRRLRSEGEAYPGFSMFFGFGPDLAYYSNREARDSVLPPGLYGLSNGGLDVPWPKVVSAKASMEQLLQGSAEDLPGRLFGLLADRSLPPDGDLPRTGVPLEVERRLGAVFVRTPRHGTRCSTVVLVGADGEVLFEERPFDRDGRPGPSVVYRFRLGAP